MATMKGYDKDEALVLMKSKIDRHLHAELGEMIDSLLSQAIDADMAYMTEAGVIDADGMAGSAYYEDDDAFEYMVEKLAAQNKLSPEQAVKVASLIDDYMDLQQEYMEKKGLVDWE